MMVVVTAGGTMLDPYRVHEKRGAAIRGRRSRGPAGHASLCPRLQMLGAFGLDEMLWGLGPDEMLWGLGLDEMVRAFGADEQCSGL